MQLREDSCLLLRVDKKSYRLALQTLHGSTFMEHGLELLLEEVESEEPLPSLSEETGSEPDEVTSDGGTESEGVGARYVCTRGMAMLMFVRVSVHML